MNCHVTKSLFSHDYVTRVKKKNKPNLKPLSACYLAREGLKAVRCSHYNMEPLGVTKDNSCKHWKL